MENDERSKGGDSNSSVVVKDGYVDWRGRPCKPNRHGGFRAASFVLGVQGFEIMAIAAVGNNLITYVINEMHFPLSKSANIVTNFVGTIFILTLFGGFLSDSYLGCFWTILIFGFIEVSGFSLLSIQAHLPQLRPPECDMFASAPGQCEEAKGFKAIVFFLALYLVALGSGCLKPNMAAYGGDQFPREAQLYRGGESKKLSTYFNAAYFAFTIGELIALTVIVWIQTHSGMDIGFGISAAAMALGLISLIAGTVFYRNNPPRGSILTPILQVFVASIAKRKLVCSSSVALYGSESHVDGSIVSPSTKKFKFLDKACIKVQDGDHKKESPWRLCSENQVEQVRLILCMIPIFACTIVFNTILAQLQTFSVQQGSAMNTHLTKHFKIPPASLQAIPYMILIFVVPLYETLCVPFLRKFTGIQSGITPLQRIGVGLFLSTFSMVAAALVEHKRRISAVDSNKIISIFWIVPQFLIFGVSEMFTAVGFIEFFYKQSLGKMQSFLTAFSYCSYSFGFFLSSILVSLVNKITSSSGGWLSDNNLNKDRLDLFYWLLASLSMINFFNYLFWSNWYSNTTSPSPSTTPHDPIDNIA
ncbi:hypothetical protein Scep_003006 [Stephania cephalantha]|uniref:Uncharacterized protein n=1 Tax=Stephania cephalantha TaxID=152367 RepID=A0AAP0Q550_9MAGN